MRSCGGSSGHRAAPGRGVGESWAHVVHLPFRLQDTTRKPLQVAERMSSSLVHASVQRDWMFADTPRALSYMCFSRSRLSNLPIMSRGKDTFDTVAHLHLRLWRKQAGGCCSKGRLHTSPRSPQPEWVLGSAGQPGQWACRAGRPWLPPSIPACPLRGEP